MRTESSGDKRACQAQGCACGTHPESGLEIYAAVARYGPVVKLIDGKNIKFAPIKKPQTVDNITLEQAVELFSYPKLLGKYKNKDVLLQKGKYGLYIKYISFSKIF